MKGLHKKKYAVTICFIITAGMCVFAQTGSSKSERTQQKQEQNGVSTKPESDESVTDVVKKARDHDVEEAETIRPVDSRSMPVKETRLNKLREKDSVNSRSSEKSPLVIALNRKQSALQELNNSIIQGDDKIIEARKKIGDAEIKLANDKKALKITGAEYKKKKEALDMAEKAVNELEIKLTEAKEFKMKIDESSVKTD